MQIKSFVFIALATSMAAVPAIAADLTYDNPAPVGEQQAYSAYDWSGFYLGAQGGYSWNKGTVLGSDQNIDSGTAGIHAGYNFQSGSIVYGIENDFNYNFEDKNDANLEWDASGRARVGYALDRTLVYATGGVAAAGGKVDVPGVGKKDDILIGWTAGGGVEHAFTNNVTVRGEYRYSDFGNKDFGSSIGDFGATQHKVIVGASYKF
ncbi:porin family protein [Ochrobactrum sp. XJ1]|nr:porin family protein [Ochrobactrum sp. XJ1]